MEKLSFKVTGEFLTNYAREKYKETSEKKQGIEFLTGSIIGFPENIAEDIILGRKKLVGENNELYLEEDDCEVEPYGCLKPSNPKDVVCGWISPEGLIFGHKGYNDCNDHISIANELVDRKMVPTRGFNSENAVEIAGYVKFSPSSVCARMHIGKVTIEQKNALIEWLEAHGYKTFKLVSHYNKVSVSSIKQMDLLAFAKAICI